MRVKLLSLMLLIGCASSANLSSAQAIATIQQIGLAEYSALRKSFYIASISAENANATEQELLTIGRQNKRLEIKIVAENYTQRRFSQQWSQSLLASAPKEELQKFSQAIDRFQHLLNTPYEQGDLISVDAAANGATTTSVNGVIAFEEQTPGFLELLLATWIGETPPSSEFKQALLTGSAPESVKEQYQTLHAKPQRIEATKQAVNTVR